MRSEAEEASSSASARRMKWHCEALPASESSSKHGKCFDICVAIQRAAFLLAARYWLTPQDFCTAVKEDDGVS